MRAYYEFFLQHSDMLEPSVILPNDASAFFRFSFVREPMRRCLSAYWNKICFAPPEDASEEDKVHLNSVNCEFFEAHYTTLGFEKKMAFEDFARMLMSHPREIMDSHLVPQTSIVDYGGQHQVDFIGRVERFSDDISRLLPVNLDELLKIHFNEGNKKTSTTEVREAVFNDLLAYYAEDYSRLRYEPLLPAGMRII